MARASSSACTCTARRSRKRKTRSCRPERVRFEAELRQLQEGLSKPGCTKKYERVLERVLERVGRIRERYAAVSGQYDIDVERDPGSGKKRPGPNAVAVRVSCRPSHGEADAGSGAYLLRTSRTDWSLRDIVLQYLQITEVEAVFRALKSELGLRPIWHQGDNQVCAHLFLTVLARHAVHLIRTRLKRGGNNLCWNSIRNRLQNWVRITTTLQEVGSWGDLPSAGCLAQCRGRRHRPTGRGHAGLQPDEKPALKIAQNRRACRAR